MYGDGSVYKDGDTWIYQWYDDAHHRRRKRFKSEREAKSYKRSHREEKQAPCRHTVGSWLREYMERYRLPSLRETSYTRLTQVCAMAAPLYDIPLDRLRPDDVQDLYTAMRPRYASSTIGKLHKLLTAAYKKAVALQLVLRDPMPAVDPVKVRVKEKEIFSFRDILHIFRGLKDMKHDKYKKSLRHDYRMLFTILLTTGMRIGEVQALRWEDIDLVRREIHVRRTMSHTGLARPKTQAGDRKIPILHQALVRRFKALKSAGYIFHTANGKPLHYHGILTAWQAIRPGPSATIHTFRHTFATRALAAGLPLLEVSRILGHSQTSTTVDMYGHAMQDYNQSLLAEIDARRKK